MPGVTGRKSDKGRSGPALCSGAAPAQATPGSGLANERPQQFGEWAGFSPSLLLRGLCSSFSVATPPAGQPLPQGAGAGSSHHAFQMEIPISRAGNRAALLFLRLMALCDAQDTVEFHPSSWKKPIQSQPRPWDGRGGEGEERSLKISRRSARLPSHSASLLGPESGRNWGCRSCLPAQLELTRALWPQGTSPPRKPPICPADLTQLKPEVLSPPPVPRRDALWRQPHSQPWAPVRYPWAVRDSLPPRACTGLRLPRCPQVWAGPEQPAWRKACLMWTELPHGAVTAQRMRSKA